MTNWWFGRLKKSKKNSLKPVLDKLANLFNGATGGPPVGVPFGASTVDIRGLNRVDELVGTEPTADCSDFAWFTEEKNYFQIFEKD